MEKYFKIMFLSLITLGCSENYNTESISYEEAQAKCEKIKEQNSVPNLEDCMCHGRIPNFNVSTITGQNINNIGLSGKLTIINFWFTTCAPCIAEIPGFNKLVEKYGEDRINFISIARNTESEVEEFLIKNPWNFQHISNESNIIDTIFKHQFGYPTTYLLDKNVIIIRSFSGGATGEHAGDFLQQRIVSDIEEALRISPTESRKNYPNNIGDAEYNPELDTKSFTLCNGENQIKQYFNAGGGLEYKGEKAEILQAFRDNYKPTNSNDSGLLTIRFVVNCKGETDRFRLYEMDLDFQQKSFSKSVSDQILSTTKSLKGWKPKSLDGNLIDYYQILSFKIEKGHIIDILP